MSLRCPRPCPLPSLSLFIRPPHPTCAKTSAFSFFCFNFSYLEKGGRRTMSGGDGRMDMHEVDFFSAETMKAVGRAEAFDLGPKVPTSCIKKEDLTIAGLNLLIANARSDLSTVDDAVLPAEDRKESKSELAAMRDELARAKEENQKLREMLNQAISNYNALQMHLTALRQQHDVVDGRVEATNDEHGEVLVPRQFMDLGLAGDADEPSHSSTATRDRPSPPLDNGGVRSMDSQRRKTSTDKVIVPPPDHQNTNREETSTEQAHEAIKRKARVSVRARSDAPMVIKISLHTQSLLYVSIDLYEQIRLLVLMFS
ncbi:hypothetical protein BHM03_00060081 [Ensete ventricosum]|nr:hypothetical protein BHM03_00060081 [Ensete ventricosum]